LIGVTCLLTYAFHHRKASHDRKVNSELLRWARAQLQGVVESVRSDDVLQLVVAAI